MLLVTVEGFEQTLGFPVERIETTLPATQIHAIPEVPEVFLGFLIYQERIVLVLNINTLFERPKAQKPYEHYVILKTPLQNQLTTTLFAIPVHHLAGFGDTIDTAPLEQIDAWLAQEAFLASQQQYENMPLFIFESQGHKFGFPVTALHHMKYAYGQELQVYAEYQGWQHEAAPQIPIFRFEHLYSPHTCGTFETLVQSLRCHILYVSLQDGSHFGVLLPRVGMVQEQKPYRIDKGLSDLTCIDAIGFCGKEPVFVLNPDKLFMRHCAILQQTQQHIEEHYQGTPKNLVHTTT